MQLIFVFPHRYNVSICLVKRQLNVHRLLTCFCLRLQYFDKAGEVTVGVGAGHQVYEFVLKELFFQAFGHASEDPDNRLFVALFDAPILTFNLIPNFFFGALSDCTGIHQYHISLVHVV